MHLVFIPARSNSKGIPEKNIQLVGSISLIERAVNSAHDCSFDLRVVLAVDEGCCLDHAQQLQASARYEHLEIFIRSAANAQDQSSTESVMAEYLSDEVLAASETISLMQVTSPFTTPSTIEKCIRATEGNGLASLTVTRRHMFRWSSTGEPLNYEPAKRPRRQDWAGELSETGAFYTTTPILYKKSRVRIAGNCNLIEVDEVEGLEIDTGTDLAVCRAIESLDKLR